MLRMLLLIGNNAVLVALNINKVMEPIARDNQVGTRPLDVGIEVANPNKHGLSFRCWFSFDTYILLLFRLEMVVIFISPHNPHNSGRCHLWNFCGAFLNLARDLYFNQQRNDKFQMIQNDISN
jgi:hypothetical protein